MAKRRNLEVNLSECVHLPFTVHLSGGLCGSNGCCFGCLDTLFFARDFKRAW